MSQYIRYRATGATESSGGLFSSVLSVLTGGSKQPAPSTYAAPIGPVSGGYVVKGKICHPSSASVLALYTELQKQLNRIASYKGLKLTDVDGRIGPDTIRLYNAVQGTNLSTCAQVAASAGASHIATLKAKADSLGAPASVPAPITSQPSIPSSSGGVPLSPPAALTEGFDLVTFVTSPMGLAVAGAVGVGAFLLVRRRRRGSGRGSSSAAAPSAAAAISAPGLTTNPARRRRRRRR